MMLLLLLTACGANLIHSISKREMILYMHIYLLFDNVQYEDGEYSACLNFTLASAATSLVSRKLQTNHTNTIEVNLHKKLLTHYLH